MQVEVEILTDISELRDGINIYRMDLGSIYMLQHYKPDGFWTTRDIIPPSLANRDIGSSCLQSMAVLDSLLDDFVLGIVVMFKYLDLTPAASMVV